MRENNERNSRKRLNALILLVAFTAVLLIVSTYAWFSTQRNVNLSNLDGTVKVAEGLEISLDGSKWSNTIDFSQYNNDQTVLKKLYGETDHNIIPTEMLPVSTLGSEEIGTGKEIKFYRGTNTDQIKLGEIKETKTTTGADNTATTAATNPDIYPGYYAIDFFLENSSAETTGEDILQLGADSKIAVKASGNSSVGLENTPRVAFALMKTDTDAAGASVAVGAQATTQAVILAATTGANSTIKDVAIWEPNAEKHVEYIVTNNNKVTFSAGDQTAYNIPATNQFTDDLKMPTYALKASAVSKTFDNLYNWDGTTVTDIAKQITLQTDSTNGAIKNLLSVSTPATTVQSQTPTGTPTEFKIPKAQVCRVRMYIWLEGQDVDCINYASHGGGITVNVGLLKDGEVG